MRTGRRWWHKSDQMCKGEVFVLRILTFELLLSIIQGGGKRALPLCLLLPGLNALRGVVQGGWGSMGRPKQAGGGEQILFPAE